MSFTSLGEISRGILSFSRALSDCLCKAPYTTVVIVIRGINIPSCNF